LLKANDAMHLATARRMNVEEVHTYDGRLRKWNGHMPFPVIEPVVAQMPLSAGVDPPDDRGTGL
jgi:hypothetical protein